MFEEIIQVTGKKGGPTSIIIAGVHGNEKCGVVAFEKILPGLQINAGRVIFVHGNPRAIEESKRFTEANLNRMFKPDILLSENEKKSYEYQRAQFLKTFLNQSDVLLDIHASSSPDSKPFIICEANAKGVVEYLPVDLIVTGFDTVEPGGTDYYMNSIGKIGISMECGYRDDAKSSLVAEEGIYAFLKARGHITNNKTPKVQSHIHMYDLYMTKTINFVLSKQFKDFEMISDGQVIGTDGIEEIVAKRDCIILFPQNIKQIGGEAFLLGEKKNSFA